MLNVVPTSVNLTDEITLLPAKVTYAQLTFEKQQFVFKTNFRVRMFCQFDCNCSSHRWFLCCS